ncbi:HNH endonuclease [Paracoccus litorisediminis]|uniref:HNH endonuclease n=1 Tax=Paracoccus litorisediminis TaxID=2006130 RepID=UPI00372DFCB2
MLAELLTTSINVQNLGARDHAALALGQEKIHAEVHKRDRHICRVCGSRVFEALEIDHIAGHRQSKAADLASICQFCHNLKHLSWAGARKRIVPIFAPDLTQSDLHRLAWMLLAWRDAPEMPVRVAKIIDMIERRRGRFEDVAKCSSAEALCEAALTIADADQIGRKAAKPVLQAVDHFARFWPAELTPEYETLDPASRLSRWNLGGFEVIADVVAEKIRNDLKPDPEKIMGLMNQIKET